MTKRMRELQTMIAAKHLEAKGYMEGETKDLDKAKTLLDEADDLQKEFDLAARVDAAEKKGAAAAASAVVGEEGKKAEKVDSVKAFADAFRKGFKAMNNETTGAEGGYTVPEDIQTRVNKYKEERYSLLHLIDQENVSTLSGARTYKKRANHTGFSVVGEGGKIGQAGKPSWERIVYNVKKRAGFMPVTNELLEDSDAAIVNELVAWLGDEGIATDNKEILALMNAQPAQAVSDMKGVKKIINVTLAAFAGSVRIVTNSDGLQYFDTLEDKNGRPLLSPDPVKPMEMYLSVGARRIPLEIVPNDILTSPEGKIPLFIGDGKEFAKKFARKGLTLKQTDSASVSEFNAFEEDLTLIRALERSDYVVKDSTAMVHAELTVTA